MRAKTSPQGLGVILGSALLALANTSTLSQDDGASHYNRMLGRGINLGNALDAPQEGAWGVKLEDSYFRVIADAGFGSVRIPIRWSTHAESTPPYRIEPDFFGRVDWAVK